MLTHISIGWFIWVPNVTFDEDAVEQVIAAPQPTRQNHTPSSVRNDLSDTNTVVLEMPYTNPHIE